MGNKKLEEKLNTYAALIAAATASNQNELIEHITSQLMEEPFMKEPNFMDHLDAIDVIVQKLLIELHNT